MLVKVGSFVKATATGNQDITLPSGLPDMTAQADGTWAIIFWQGGGTSGNGIWDAHHQAMIGFVAKGGGSLSQYSCSCGGTDAAAVAETSRRMAAAAITGCNAAGTAANEEAQFVSFPTATTMRLNWTTNVTGARNVNYMILTGLTGAKVVNWTTPTAVGTKAVTGVGFNPDLVLHASSVTAAGSSGTTAYLGFGAMNKHGQQWANAIVSLDASDPTATCRYQQTDAAFVITQADNIVAHQEHFQSMDADGFSMYASTVNGAAQNVISLCLDGVGSKIGAFNLGASPQTVTTRHDFTSRGALFASIAESPLSTPVTFALWSLGATDGTNSRASALADRDAVATSEADSIWLNDAPIYAPTGGSPPGTLAKGTTSFSTSDMTITWSTADAGEEILYCLLGDAGEDTFPAMVSA